MRTTVTIVTFLLVQIQEDFIMIYVLLVDGFEEIEALTPIDILRRAGASVLTVGVNSKKVTGSHDITVEADILMNDVKKDDMECLIVPGGPGYTNIEASEDAISLISYAAENEILLCAICAAPSMLGKLGILDGKRATCFPGYEQYLKGATVVADKAVFDSDIITGKGAGAASEFGFLIAGKIVGTKKAEEIKKAMQY